MYIIFICYQLSRKSNPVMGMEESFNASDWELSNGCSSAVRYPSSPSNEAGGRPPPPSPWSAWLVPSAVACGRGMSYYCSNSPPPDLTTPRFLPLQDCQRRSVPPGWIRGNLTLISTESPSSCCWPVAHHLAASFWRKRRTNLTLCSWSLT